MTTEKKFIPMTPAGSALFHIAAETEEKAWESLMHELRYMPYKTKQDAIDRGYCIGEML